MLVLLAVGLGTSSAVALEAENPRFVPPYPKPFHLGSSSKGTTSEGVVPIVFAAKEPEGEGTQIVLTCRWFKGSGEVTGPKTLTTTLTLNGCKSATGTSAARCSNTEKPEEIVAAPSNGELGRISPNTVGVRLEFNLEAVCRMGTSTFPLTVKGSAIGQINPLATKSNRFTLRFTRSGYEQVPTMFEGGPPTVLVSAVGAAPPEPTAVETNMFLKFPVVTEIKP
ncbi:MAG TPA: hypothetical protein VGO14_01390 [Solirubrobacteraceae bacterium]|nr:hypothetical protein [Solirubrobacteraceae bacterium]